MRYRRDIAHSKSDQTGVKHQILASNPPLKEGSTGSHEKYDNHMRANDTKWQQFWPKPSSTSETFFRYNAKPSLNEDKILNECIPEHIAASPLIPRTCSAKDNKNDLRSDVLTLYLEKEKYESKLRPKVSYLFTMLRNM